MIEFCARLSRMDTRTLTQVLSSEPNSGFEVKAVGEECGEKGSRGSRVWRLTRRRGGRT